MENDLKKESHKFEIEKIVFYISLLYYILWICTAIWCFFFGSGFELLPALGNHQLDYGLDALINILLEFIGITLFRFPFVPIYQLIYIFSKKK